MKILKDCIPGLLFILSSILSAIVVDLINNETFLYLLLCFYSTASAACGIIYIFMAIMGKLMGLDK